MDEKLKIIIEAETQKAQQALGKLQGKIAGFTNAVGKKLEGVNANFKAMGDVVSKVFKTFVAGAGAVIAALVGMNAGTEEYRANQGKLITAFESVGLSAETAADTYEYLYSVLGDDGAAVEASAHLAKLTNDEQALAEWTNIATGIYGTFGDSLPIESLAEAANETA
jgi:hypothetical protein